MAFASMVLGLLAVPFGLATAGIVPLLAAAFGFTARGRIRRNGGSGLGMATAGVVLGIVAFGLHLVLAIVLFVVLRVQP